MKLKTLAAIAASSILAVSIAYAAPASDMNSSQSNPAASENIGATPSANGNAQANSAPGMDLSANNIDPMPMEAGDDMSADTATGDDDY